MSTTFYNSRGFLCTLLAVTLGELSEATEATGVAPILVQNGIEYFDRAATDKLARYLRDRQPNRPKRLTVGRSARGPFGAGASAPMC